MSASPDTRALWADYPSDDPDSFALAVVPGDVYKRLQEVGVPIMFPDKPVVDKASVEVNGKMVVFEMEWSGYTLLPEPVASLCNLPPSAFDPPGRTSVSKSLNFFDAIEELAKQGPVICAAWLTKYRLLAGA